jgi:hypothetical protein
MKALMQILPVSGSHMLQAVQGGPPGDFMQRGRRREDKHKAEQPEHNPSLRVEPKEATHPPRLSLASHILLYCMAAERRLLGRRGGWVRRGLGS